MRTLRPPSPAPAPADAFVAAVISSPPSPYALGSPAPSPGPGPAPVPEPSAAAASAVGGRRGGGGGAALSPPLIAMLAVVGAALLVVLYARLISRVFRAARRRWRRRRLRLLMAPGSPSSIAGDSFTTYDNFYHTFSPFHGHGLDDAAIKSLPSAHFLASSSSARGSGAGERECAVCLLEFADGDELRALPPCAHAFHADCVDVWLRAHASCPLCRAAVALLLPPSPIRAGPPAAPRRDRAAAGMRPSLDDLLFFHPVPPVAHDGGFAGLQEIVPASPDRRPLDPRDFLLKRSYSFGFERSLASADAASSTASPPWRFRFTAAGDGGSRRGSSNFWSKRWPSPFGGGGGSAAARVFSFRSYRSAAAAKSSPFSRRRGGAGSGFFFMSLASEPPSILAAARRARAPSTSRLRCGDPEALLSPDRLGGR
ncbi:hypothetical protein PR202_ga11986 [Eleusine coracana subsp. coracana]|uniref:RING-type E3 ubiquitin transferase n=1 Tax=Eleusine coracana subsp. coracana TaxID=191504 RepID=A0AAV5CAP2_ELECO|nr:hypothetical protein QOZ80_5AG0396400 [Eleusine coracana subsp. coracana]GJM95273.1 hypothetical protein PR202_ga11986 [Eleusine coracana subsp. coracana]